MACSSMNLGLPVLFTLVNTTRMNPVTSAATVHGLLLWHETSGTVNSLSPSAKQSPIVDSTGPTLPFTTLMSLPTRTVGGGKPPPQKALEQHVGGKYRAA